MDTNPVLKNSGQLNLRYNFKVEPNNYKEKFNYWFYKDSFTDMMTRSDYFSEDYYNKIGGCDRMRDWLEFAFRDGYEAGRMSNNVK